MTVLQYIGELTGLRTAGHILLDAATVGLFIHESPTAAAIEHWTEVALKWGMMLVAIGAHIYTIKKVRSELNKNKP